MLEIPPLKATAKQSADNPIAMRIIDIKSLLSTNLLCHIRDDFQRNLAAITIGFWDNIATAYTGIIFRNSSLTMFLY